MKGKVIVEQVDKKGNIIEDYDESISRVKLYSNIKKYFPNICQDEEGVICGKYDGKKYAIRVENSYARRYNYIKKILISYFSIMY